MKRIDMPKKVIILFISGIIIFASGIYLGYRKGTMQGVNVVTSLYDDSVSINIRNKIKLLTHIREGDIYAGKDMLESLLDTDISYLGVKIIKANTAEKNVIEALREAKEYRQKHADHKPNEVLSKTIEETFQKIP